MAQDTKYQLHLKGFVGGYDFDADYVDYILAKNNGKEVNVLIDSLGGQSNTALSIFSAFKRHGNVNVHFVGMNANAATIASLGAKRITMDSSAMYLVHKCSIAFFEWGNLNADDLQTLIENIEKQKADLDKLDANIAQMYAKRCKKSPSDLLQLMKKGGWLNAKEALAWGFVDELTDYDGETAPVLTDATAHAMASAGIPIPDLPTTKDQSAVARFFNALASFFKSQETTLTNSTLTATMPKTLTNICKILNCDTLEINGGNALLNDTQLETLESSINSDKETIKVLTEKTTTLETKEQTLETQNKELETEIKSLKSELADLKMKPAETTAQVVNDQTKKSDKTPIDNYLNTIQNAKSLFTTLP